MCYIILNHYSQQRYKMPSNHEIQQAIVPDTYDRGQFYIVLLSGTFGEAVSLNYCCNYSFFAINVKVR